MKSGFCGFFFLHRRFWLSSSTPGGPAILALPVEPAALRSGSDGVKGGSEADGPEKMELSKMEVDLFSGKKLLSHFGGPQQYLQQAHPDTNSFAVTLGLEFSTTRQDVNFVTSLPADDSTMFCLKLSDLSFSPESSTKPAPYLTTAIRLLDEYLCNSFISESNFNACHASIS